MSGIIDGVNAATAQALVTGRPSVISISIGGPPNASLDAAVCFIPIDD